MIFFIAEGEPNACGPGCSEWIAAEGKFDGPQVERRFRDLLATLKGRNLPIVFNSLGGVIGEALVLGRILREHRMTASVGESYPEGCKAPIAADESCRQIMQSNRELKARLAPRAPSAPPRACMRCSERPSVIAGGCACRNSRLSPDR